MVRSQKYISGVALRNAPDKMAIALKPSQAENLKPILQIFAYTLSLPLMGYWQADSFHKLSLSFQEKIAFALIKL